MKTIHNLVLFIGDEPSIKNIDPAVPFVGTRSYKNLLDWCYRMDIDIRLIDFANSNNGFDDLCRVDGDLFHLSFAKVVCLGKRAHTRFKKFCLATPELIGLAENIFYLPHPSPLNRMLNDRRQLNRYLNKCREFIYEKTN